MRRVSEITVSFLKSRYIDVLKILNCKIVFTCILSSNKCLFQALSTQEKELTSQIKELGQQVKETKPDPTHQQKMEKEITAFEKSKIIEKYELDVFCR